MTNREQEEFIRRNRNLSLEQLSAKTGLRQRNVRKILQRTPSEKLIPSVSRPLLSPSVQEDRLRILVFMESNPTFWAAVLLLGAVMGLFGKAFITPNLMVSGPPGDLVGQFYSWREFGFSELAKGHLALWNPYLFCGAPYFAGFQSALLYPPNWLFMVLPLVFALNFSVALHVFLAGFFMYLWLSRNSVNFFPRLFGAFVFMLGGAYFSHVYPGHLSNLCTMAWFPLVFLMIDGHLRSPSLKWILGGIAAFSMELLAGHVQYFIYSLFFAGIYSLVFVSLDRNRWLEKISGALMMVLGALAVTAIQCLPGWVAAGENLRNGNLPYEQQFVSALTPLDLITVVTSGLNGNPDRFGGWGGGIFIAEGTLFVGSIAFFFALYGLRENRDVKRWVWLGLALLAVVLALGFYTPIYPFLYEWVPTFDAFRGSYKFAIFLQLAFAYLGALGLEAYLYNSVPKPWPAWSAFLLSLVFIVAAVGIYQDRGWSDFSSVLDLFGKQPLSGQYGIDNAQVDAVRIVNLTETAMILLVFGGLWIWTQTHRGWKMALALLGIANLLFFAKANVSFFNSESLEQDKTTLENNLVPTIGDNRVFWQHQNNRSLSARLHDIWGNDPSIPKRYEYFLRYAVGTPYEKYLSGSPLNIGPVMTPEKERLIRLIYIIDESDGKLKVTKKQNPELPRALLLDRWEMGREPEEAMNRLDDPKFDPAQTILLERDPDPLPQGGPTHGKVMLQDITTDLIEVKAQTDRPEVLLIGENYDSGWKVIACNDSAQQNYEVMPGDYIDQAIPLSAGNHHFYLKYEAEGFLAGEWVSGISLIIFFGAFGWTYLRRTKPVNTAFIENNNPVKDSSV